jgi:hypothetical protein
MGGPYEKKIEVNESVDFGQQIKSNLICHIHMVSNVNEQGVQERAESTPLWGPSVEDQRGGDVVSYPHHLGAAR